MPVKTTADLVNRATQLQGALNTCSAQIDGIQRWQDETLQKVNKPATK